MVVAEQFQLLKVPRRLERHKKHQSYILEDGSKAFGASTIAGVNKPIDPLMGWAAKLAREGKDWRKERNTSADIGTIAHFMVECHLCGDDWDLSEFTDKEIALSEPAFEKFVRFWEKNESEVIATEKQLVSEKYGYGGTIDLVGISKNKERILWDWKTSARIYEGMKFQVGGGYLNLWDENYPDERIDRAAIVRIGKEDKGDFEIYWLPTEDIDKYWKCFLARLEVLRTDKNLNN